MIVNSCCPVFYLTPDEIQESPCDPISIDDTCDGCKCHCGYIQYESLTPYFQKLKSLYTQDDDHLILEARLRQQIVEISRFFDAETNAKSGAYSKGHIRLETLYADGTSYLKIPEFVPGTLELYKDNCLINPDTYALQNGFLIYKPCQQHDQLCGCRPGCGEYTTGKRIIGWHGCFVAKAQFGRECADEAVQMAVRAYLIEFNTFGDEKEARYEGHTATRAFRVPHVWQSLVDKYTAKKKTNQYFGFA